MSAPDMPSRIWAIHHETQGAVMIGEWADTMRHLGGAEYTRADLAASRALRETPGAAEPVAWMYEIGGARYCYAERRSDTLPWQEKPLYAAHPDVDSLRAEVRTKDALISDHLRKIMHLENRVEEEHVRAAEWKAHAERMAGALGKVIDSVVENSTVSGDQRNFACSSEAWGSANEALTAHEAMMKREEG